jgi:hypothetical protein
MIISKDGGADKGNNKSVIIADHDGDVDCVEEEKNEVMSCQLKAANQEKNNKGTKLGARVTGSFKGRAISKTNGKATLENIVVNRETNKMTTLFREQFQQGRGNGNHNGIVNDPRGFKFQAVGLPVNLTMNGDPNVPRPLDSLHTPPISNSPPLLQNKEDSNVEKENFLDASDQVGDGSSDSDMEVVKETPAGDL